MNDAKDGWLAVQFVEQRGDTVTVKTTDDEVSSSGARTEGGDENGDDQLTASAPRSD